MHGRTRNQLLQLGFDTSLIQKIGDRSQTVSGLRGQNKAALESAGFTSDEAAIIINKVNRSSIDKSIIQNIIEKSGMICCFCADGNRNKPFQIHHIEEYHISQNHSEDNLLLVCPTHHVQIHQAKYSISYQLHIKRKWENLWDIAKSYQSRGLDFPFGAIEFIDYDSVGSVTEIFNFTAPRPSVCVTLSKGTFADEALKILNSENRLIISGDSGSGKTTMIYGIAGTERKKRVYKYTHGDATEKPAAAEILEFLSHSSNVILIVDDANSKLHGDSIEKILKAADAAHQIIIVNTRNDFKGDSNIEEHFINSTIYLSWSEIRYSVKTSLLAEETTVVDDLKAKDQNDSNHFPLGHGELNRSLKSLIDTYLETSDTVWQFIYLISGGLNKVHQVKVQLYHRERFDLIFLFISTKQISEFENGSNIEEILNFYRTNSVLNKSPEPDEVWLKGKLDELCARRYLKNERGRYKTIHRRLALKYIEHFFTLSQAECSEVLDIVFRNYANVKEIAILWSWIQNSGARSYLTNWCKTTDFNKLIEHACYESVNTLALLSRNMHQAAEYRKHPVVNSAFKDRAEEIADLMNTDEKSNFFYFSQLLNTLRTQAVEAIKPISEFLNKEKLVIAIRQSEPRDYKYIHNVFQDIWEVCPEWIFEITKSLGVDDYNTALLRVKKGDITSIDHIIRFYKDFVINLRRSNIKAATARMYDVLLDCPLTEIEIPTVSIGLIYVTMFKADVEKIFSALDEDRLAKELSNTSPRYWSKLTAFSTFLIKWSNDKLANILAKVDLDLLQSNLEKHFEDTQYEFRVLIYLFTNGSDETKTAFATRITPLIEKIYLKPDRDGNNRNDILEAFNKLAPTQAAIIMKKTGIILPNKDLDDNEELDFDIETIFPEELSGQDYILNLRTIDSRPDQEDENN